jgi:hypothetical protein
MPPELSYGTVTVLACPADIDIALRAVTVGGAAHTCGSETQEATHP